MVGGAEAPGVNENRTPIRIDILVLRVQGWKSFTHRSRTLMALPFTFFNDYNEVTKNVND